MKIWVIGRNYPQKENNQQGSFELEQAKMLMKRGNEVTYIACRFHSPLSKERNGFFSLEVEGLSVFYSVRTAMPHFSRTRFHLPYFPAHREKKMEYLLKKAEEKNGLPDVIHIHDPTVILSSQVFKRYYDRGVKVFTTEHWTKVRSKRIDPYEIKEQKRYLDYVDQYMCVGYGLRDALREITETNQNIVIMPDIINDIFWQERKKHQGYNFTVIGRLEKIKQVDKIIEAFTELYKGDMNYRLIVVGNGSQYDDLRDQVKNLAMEQQIQFTGILTREMTAQTIASADCVICFSRLETFGVPIIESWACGIPVITTTAQEIMENWDDRLGISIDSADVTSLKTSMRKMADQADKYDGSFIREYARSHYSEDVIYDKLMRLYDDK